MESNVQDTPQPEQTPANPNDVSGAFGQSVEGSSSELSVDDIILGKDTTAPAFGTPETENVGQEVPQQEAQGTDNAFVPATNDEKRFQYWQSEADKQKFENQKLQEQNAALQQQMVQAQQQPQQAPAQAPVEEEFPPAPEKPKKPAYFSREEAYSDPKSDSAAYLDSVEEWRDTMTQYSSLRSQYDIAKMQEKQDAVERQRQAQIKEQQAYAQQQKQLSDTKQWLANQHGIQGEEADKFISHMSSPESMTMDNLVQLWRIQNGNNAPANPAPVQTQTAPSEAFQQTQRAQQVPNPMGVMPSAGNEDPRSTEDQMMDTMVADFKRKNPWG